MERRRACYQAKWSSISSVVASACAWKGVADRQLRRREDSEHGRVCGSSRPDVKENRFTRVLDYHGDLAEFQELFPILEDTYHGLDTVLRKLASRPWISPLRTCTSAKELEANTSNSSRKSSPFGLSDTTEAAWDHFKGIDKIVATASCTRRQRWSTVAHVAADAVQNLDQPFTIIEDFTKEVYSNSSRADMEMKQIVRRFVEPDRDVIIFVWSRKPSRSNTRGDAGLTYHLRSYVVAKRAPASTADHNLSLLQFCSRISIDKEHGVAYDPVHVRALTRFLIGNTAGNLRCYQERIENALVDQALKRQLQ
ncbi:hypothetical protein GQ600_12212 [Phytophthora cactorum]|nr:hypothetical protein GQ600_12212 [Phytophthora cactorum]